MRVVVALGGNALLRRGERPDAAPQVDQVRHVATPLGQLAQEHELVVVHGNGPQVGLLALESAADASLSRPYPLGDLVAETQGLIGYWLQQALGRSAATPVVTLVTQTVVDGHDPAFATPTKFVGSVYAEDEAIRLGAEHDWTFARDGDTWRRVVASPLPRRVVEAETADLLLRQGVTVVLAGGGGIPVTEGDAGLEAIEAVVDKDRAAALVAQELGCRAARHPHRCSRRDDRLGHTRTAPVGRGHRERPGLDDLPGGLHGTQGGCRVRVRQGNGQPCSHRLARRRRRGHRRDAGNPGAAVNTTR